MLITFKHEQKMKESSRFLLGQLSVLLQVCFRPVLILLTEKLFDHDVQDICHYVLPAR